MRLLDETVRPRAVDGTDAPQELMRLAAEAEKAAASDIHLQQRPNGVEVSFRLDGVLTPVLNYSLELGRLVLGRIKFLARLKTYDDQLPQDGRIDRDALRIGSDVRVSTYPTVTGEKVVLRLYRESAAPDLKGIDLEESVLSAVRVALRQPSGLVLLTGPAGSGKTTTIYACIRHLLDSGGRHIITVEDPVEQVLEGVMQTEINEARGLTFAEAARHLLRQDPQVLVVGEIRDEATAHLVVRAALTGHLVLSTLHAGSCRGVIERLLSLCSDTAAVASGLSLILNQRLVRRVCPACSGTGCGSCVQTGYRGRVPVVECLSLTDALRARVRAGDLLGIAPEKSLMDAARGRVDRRETTVAELERVLGG